LTVAAAACSASGDTTTPAGAAAAGRGGRGRGGGGAQPVVVAKVSQKDVPVDIAAVGNVEAFVLVTVRSQITGQLDKVFIHEGDMVRKGDPLFTIDPRPYQSALEQAAANLTRDQALLNQAEAQLARDASNAEYQQLTAERQGQLAAKGIISKDAADQVKSQADATAALVKADKAAVESAKAQMVVQQAAVDAARVQLGYTKIDSPINGRLGDVMVKTGNLVTANNTMLMTIAQIEPVFVTFSVPAVHLPTITRQLGGDKLSVVATPQDADMKSTEGKLTFVDNAVDPTTDTIKLKATFANTDRRLVPGQFARVSLRLNTIPNATVVPSQAVQTGQDGQFVFVVTDKATVDQRPVLVGQRVADDIVITKGLQPGETVVTEGQLRLEQGTRVQVGDANAPGRGGRGGRGRRGGGEGGGEGGGNQRGGGGRQQG
jgi:multidrug efflux system membrane fusion protein